uniref:Ankyrin repeat and SOCS box protein 1 isoform X1 n=1 Tax=Sus scrofa TaxID=9823 RepID=A0A480HZC3_PIG
MEPTISWFLVGFVFTVPWRELLFCLVFFNYYNLVDAVDRERLPVRTEPGPLTSGLFKDLQCLGVHLPSASRLWAQGLPLHQVQVGSELYEQANEGRLAAVPQDRIHDAAGGAPVEALRVDGAVAVEVGVCAGLEQQLEALEVVVGCADVQGADHQGREPPGERGLQVRSQVVVDVHVGPVPDEGLQDVRPAHSRRVVDRGAAVVPAPVGVGAGFQQDLGALQVPVHHGHVQGGLALHVHQVHLGPLPDEEVHAVAVARGGGDAQRRAGQPAAAPDRLLIDAAPVALLLQQGPEGLEVPHVGRVMEPRVLAVLQRVVTELLPQPLLQIRTCTAGPGPARPPPSAMGSGLRPVRGPPLPLTGPRAPRDRKQRGRDHFRRPRQVGRVGGTASGGRARASFRGFCSFLPGPGASACRLASPRRDERAPAPGRALGGAGCRGRAPSDSPTAAFLH